MVGYQFPYNPLRTIYDNNWLMVRIRLTEGVLVYDFDDPCMTYWPGVAAWSFTGAPWGCPFPL